VKRTLNVIKMHGTTIKKTVLLIYEREIYVGDGMNLPG
jgi:hypothetical protein